MQVTNLTNALVKRKTMNKTWNWTVFQLMTQAGMQEMNEKDVQETNAFLANILNKDAFNFPSLYK